MNENLAPTGADQSGPLELGKEARRTLPRGPGELRDLGLRGLDQDGASVAARPVGAAGLDLSEHSESAYGFAGGGMLAPEMSTQAHPLAMSLTARQEHPA